MVHQVTQVRSCFTLNRQRGMVQMHDLPHIIVPLFRIQRGQLVRDAQRRVAFDHCRRKKHPAPGGVIPGLFAVEEVEGHGIDADRDAEGQFQGRTHRQDHGVRTGFQDGGMGEDEIRSVHDVLGNGRDNNKEAVSMP